MPGQAGEAGQETTSWMPTSKPHSGQETATTLPQTLGSGIISELRLIIPQAVLLHLLRSHLQPARVPVRRQVLQKALQRAPHLRLHHHPAPRRQFLPVHQKVLRHRLVPVQVHHRVQAKALHHLPVRVPVRRQVLQKAPLLLLHLAHLLVQVLQKAPLLLLHLAHLLLRVRPHRLHRHPVRLQAPR